jgi:signal transduction histidine kinase
MTWDLQEMSSDRSLIAALIELASVDRGDWDSTIQHILGLEARVLDVERMSFWTVRNEEQVLFCEMAYHRPTGVFERGATLASSEDADLFEAIRKSTPLDVEDVRTDPRMNDPGLKRLRDYLSARHVSALLGFPILPGGKLAGLICLEHVGPPRRWSASDERFAAAVAQTATAALEARERREAQEGARRNTAFLDQTSRTLGETLEVEEVARRAIALSVPRLADGVEIDIVEDGAPRRLAFDYATGQGRSLIQAALPDRPFERGGEPYIVDLVISHKGSVLVSDINDQASAVVELHDPKIVAALRALGTRSLIAVPLRVSGGIVGVVTFVTSTRRYGLDDLGLAEEFARRLAAALENARLHQRAQAAVRVRDEFIALAGHELRTPVTALQLSTQELARRSPSAPREEIERMARRLVKQVQRLDRLSARMLDATQISAKRLPLSRAPADLAEIARDAAETFAPLLGLQGCSLRLEADGPVPGLWDASQLEQVVATLLDNAAKFGAGKPVEIAARREGENAILSVRDHGPGIPPDRVHRIFEPFERAVSAKHYGGLGLGLYIARAIVEEHGGTLTVDSRLGEGTTFTARLPPGRALPASERS